ncbi:MULTISPECIES: hypothetical protein [unclassified Leucobacter]|uniref:hypothetical protein n=1 Tax=unclassified Leucobacter TaxID=2621730 RepID=UPI000622557B|nr:hypothetical protein [Leucobacter sp. Ag1]KKI21994.1 hypothetical protein XM48_03415 [Leucobacter sp. Ag1]
MGQESKKTASAKPAPAGRRKQLLRNWGAVALAAIVLGAIFGGPAITKYLKAPPISDDFGIEDAIAAMRLDADGTSYLVLVNPQGRTRSVQLEERGFERSRIAWSDAGLSTGGPTDEYLLGAKSLTRLPLPGDLDRSTEWGRFATRDGFAVQMSTQEGQRLAFVNAKTKQLTSVKPEYAHPELANCDGELVAVGEDGHPRTIDAGSRDISGLGTFTGVQAMTCDGDRIIGIGEIPDRADSTQTVRIWDRASGAQRTLDVRYPEALSRSGPSMPFVNDGRLYWAADRRLWSIPVGDAALGGAGAGGSGASGGAGGSGASGGSGAAGSGAAGGGSAPTIAEAIDSATLTDFLDDFEPVVGTDQGVLDRVGDRVYGVAAQEKYIDDRRGPGFDRLDRLAIFSVDARTGERRIVLDVDTLDFPRRNLHVHAIAVNPKWAAAR